MCNPALRSRHWQEMSEIYERSVGNLQSPDTDGLTPNAGTTLRKFIALELMKDIEKYQVVSIGANKELALALKLEQMIDKWNTMDFTIIQQRSQHQRERSVFAHLDDIEMLMEDHAVTIDEMKVSYFVSPIADALVDFSVSLARVRDTIKEWMSVQEEWFDLEAVFIQAASSESYDQLLHARDLFFQVNEALETIKRDMINAPKFASISNGSKKFLQILADAGEKLEIVKETVGNYIQGVRNVFPRFYFISDREIMNILFEPVFSIKMKLLLTKCFIGIQSLRLDHEGTLVLSIIDSHNEELSVLDFSHCDNNDNSDNNGSVSSCIAMETAIIRAVRNTILQCFRELDSYNMKRLTSCCVGMARVCSLSVYWTLRMEKSFLSIATDDDSSSAAKSRLTHEEEQSDALKSLIAELRKIKGVSRKLRKSLVCLIIQIRHQQDITRLVINRDDFNWKAQFRHYWRDNNVKVNILDTEVPYGYEYSACEKPLIDTPLTDRCYRTLIEAHRNRLYGLIFGHTAVGKTQSIKSMARILAFEFRLVNCHDSANLNYRYITNVLNGLVGCQSVWLCFEHLDSLPIEMHSILAQRISNLSSNGHKFISATITSEYLENSTNSQCLPNSLKILFRPIAVMQPDTRRIVEIELFAEGFVDATILGYKMRLFQEYSNDQLPTEVFDTRITKSVVKTAANLKIRYPDESEDTLLVRALVDVYLPKLRPSSIVTFQHIIDDVFPMVFLPPPNYGSLLSAMERIGIDRNDRSHLYNLKIIQLFEMLFVRHALIVVGSTLCGKTSIIDTLTRSLSLLSMNDDGTFCFPLVQTVRINHNSLTPLELFGRWEGKASKLRWKDGTFTKNLRKFAEDRKEKTNRIGFHWQWLILDGPLDNPWLTNKLSPLLDDEKTLYLTSGESIRMTSSMSVIIETLDLREVSPATISRCGIIHVDDETIGWKGHMRRWIAENRCALLPPVEYPDENNDRDSSRAGSQDKYVRFIESLLEWSLTACLNFAFDTSVCRSLLINSKSYMVVSVLRLFEMFLSDALEAITPEVTQSAERASLGSRWNVSHFYLWSQAALIMSIVWGIGGSIDHSSRIALDEFCTSIWRDGQRFTRPELIKPYDLALPSQGLIQDHMFMFSGTGNWKQWSDILKKDSANLISEASPDKFMIIDNIYVPSLESLKYMNIFQNHVKHRKPFIVLGETATGKTLYMRHLLKSKSFQTTCSSNFVTLQRGSQRCNVYRSRRLQRMFLTKMTKKLMGTYGPIGNGHLCVNFLDDLAIDDSINGEAEAALEMIRQYHDNVPWHDIESGEDIRLSNVVFIGAICQDSRNDWRNRDKLWLRQSRFFRHFNLYDIHAPSKESIFKIYSSILMANMRMNLFNPDVSGSVTSMVNATIDLYSAIRKRLLPIPRKFQYRFSLRDFARVISGCSLIHKESVETKITFIRLWVHEAFRVFADRIVDNEDAEWLFDRIRESVKSHFKDSFEATFDHLPKNHEDQLTRESFRQLIFSDFMRSSTTGVLDGESGHRASQSNGIGKENNGMSNNDNAPDGHKRCRYEEITCSREVLRNKAQLYLDRYNEDKNDEEKLNILIFPDMLEHLIRLCRILCIPGGSLLMICFGGSARRSLTALAAHLKGQRFQELSCPVVSSGSLAAAWKKDLKSACMSCIAPSPTAASGTRATTKELARGCTFFMTDRQILGACPSFLDDICSIMKTGQVPDLFTHEEKEKIVQNSRLLAQNGDRNLEMSSLQIIDYFYTKCREKLHFVFYFERVVGNIISSNNISLEGIVSNCSIDCYEGWPEEALLEIATKFMRDIDIDREIKSKVIVASKYFYDSVERSRWGWTRGSGGSKGSKLPIAAYIHMVKLYGILMTKKQNEIRTSRKRYLNGLEKLQLAGEEVREMKTILTKLRPQLELSAEETADTMRKIERENISVENATVQVKREEVVANNIAEVAGILKSECEADLAVAIPILEDAIAALNTLKPTDITLVKAMKNPPDTVKLVLAAVCVMLNVPPDRSVDPVTGKKSIDYWAPSKRILGDMNFLQNLKDYDKDNIAPSIMSVVNKTYMNDENFMPHIVAKASSAAEGLCKWVRAMVSYDEVAKVVAPKKEKLAAAEKECNNSLEYLNEKRKSLAALNDKLAGLNVVLEATLAKKLQLENQVANCTGKLIKAEGLITSLAGEKARWLSSADALAESYRSLAGDLLLSCGIVAFLGAFDAIHRRNHLYQWTNQLNDLSVPNSQDSYDFVSNLESEVQLSTWHYSGLSNNSFTDSNAVIMNNSLLWPLFLDPQNQANLWIRRMEAPNKLRIIKATDPSWLDELETSIEQDLPCLLENVDSSKYLETGALDYVLAHVCPRRSLHNIDIKIDGCSNGRRCNFLLYITSRLSSLNEAERSSLEPHLYKRLSVINFSLADEALEDRLLEIVVSREKPELQDTFDKLAAEGASNRRVLKQEEDKILAILSGSGVNIIEDERAIETLDYSKNLSLKIMKREELARGTNLHINLFRNTYRPFTKYCAALYDTLGSLAKLNHMYRFSLDWFTRLYVRSIDTSKKSVVLDKRLRYVEGI